MNAPKHSDKRAWRGALGGALSLLFVSAPLWACGPFLSGRELLADRAGTALAAPRADFRRELRGVHPASSPGLRAAPSPEPFEQTAAADRSELGEALQASGAADAESIAKSAAEVRAVLQQNSALIAPAGLGTGGVADPSLLGALRVPAGLPGEFADYLEGAIAFHQGRPDAARAAWRRLLARPEAERRYRSTWAAFMTGRSLMGSDLAGAARSLADVRGLVRAGFKDSLGLAAASLGLEGKLALRRRDFAAAAELYLEQQEAGDETAAPSLRRLSWTLLAASDAERQAAVRSDAVRLVLIAHLASTEGALTDPASPASSLLALWVASTEGQSDVKGADRLAWAEYQAGHIDAAERWAARASDASPIAGWIRSKLLLRKGKVAEAAALLARAVKALPADPSFAPGAPQSAADAAFEGERFESGRRLKGELAVLRLARSQYTEALTLLLDAGYWRDAAFVAERVLTANELAALVDRRFPPAAADKPGAGERTAAQQVAFDLRYLLARRLARLGQRGRAAAYYPAELRPRIAALEAALEAAARASDPAEARARALFTAAQIERREGMELLGTEGGPDWRVDGGSYDEASYEPAPSKAGPRLTAPAERARVRASAPAPASRFHYRHVAARHAYEAALLAADGSAEQAAMLCRARQWVAGRDAAAAARYAAAWKEHGARGPCP